MIMRRPIRAAGDGRVEVRLDPHEVGLLGHLLDELGVIIDDPDAAGPDAARRLEPAAHPDDPLAEDDYRALAGTSLRDDRRRAATAFAATLERGRDRSGGCRVTLSPEEVESWLTSVNHLRLALGTVLGVTEDMAVEEIPEDDPRRHQLAVYHWLTWLLDGIVEVLM